jgi:hypothetical protein
MMNPMRTINRTRRRCAEIERMKRRAEEEAGARATSKANIQAVLWIYAVVAVINALVMLFTGQPWWAILMIAPIWPL